MRVNFRHQTHILGTYLPAANKRIVVEATCKETPNAKTTTAIMSDFRRPILSPNGAANKAPKKVPALNIDTISDDCVGVIAGMPLSSVCPVEK